MNSAENRVSDDWDADLREEREEEKVVSLSCGFCGAPMNKYKDVVDAPDGYNPDDYPHDACASCQREQSADYVTHEMALDAGDPSLEGQRW